MIWGYISCPLPTNFPSTDDSYLNQFMEPNDFLIPSFLDDSNLMILQHPLMTKELVFTTMVVKWFYKSIISSSFISWNSSVRRSFPHPPSFLPPSFHLSFLSFFFILYLSGWICRFFFLHSVYYNPLPSLFNAQLSLTSQCLNCSIAGNSDLFKLASVSFWFIILWSLPYFLPKPGVPDSSCIFLVPTLGSSISPDGPGSFFFF